MKRDILPFVHCGMIGVGVLWNLLCILWIVPLNLYRISIGVLMMGNAGVIAIGLRSGSRYVKGTWRTCKTAAERRARVIGIILAFLWGVTTIVCVVNSIQA